MIGAILTVVMAASGTSADSESGRPSALVALVACRTIPDEKRRVLCYDREVEALDSAERDRKIVVLDQEQVRTTRRSLFGFALPALKLFSGRPADSKNRDAANEELMTLDTVVTKIERLGDGQVMFIVEGGARWVQTDDRTLSLARARPGTKVHFTKGALGSYFAAFEHAIAIKVRRLN